MALQKDGFTLAFQASCSSLVTYGIVLFLPKHLHLLTYIFSFPLEVHHGEAWRNNMPSPVLLGGGMVSLKACDPCSPEMHRTRSYKISRPPHPLGVLKKAFPKGL